MRQDSEYGLNLHLAIPIRVLSGSFTQDPSVHTSQLNCRITLYKSRPVWLTELWTRFFCDVALLTLDIDHESAGKMVSLIFFILVFL